MTMIYIFLSIIFFILFSSPFFYLLQRPPVAFYIDNLEPGSSYRIILFAVNAKGRSEPTIIDDITFKGVAKYTGESIKIYWNPISLDWKWLKIRIGHTVVMVNIICACSMWQKKKSCAEFIVIYLTTYLKMSVLLGLRGMKSINLCKWRTKKKK